MDHNGLVFSPHLNFGHLLNDICHSSQVGTAAVRTPVCDVELFHPATLTTLRTHSKQVVIEMSNIHNTQQVIKYVETFDIIIHTSFISTTKLLNYYLEIFLTTIIL